MALAVYEVDQSLTIDIETRMNHTRTFTIVAQLEAPLTLVRKNGAEVVARQGGSKIL